MKTLDSTQLAGIAGGQGQTDTTTIKKPTSPTDSIPRPKPPIIVIPPYPRPEDEPSFPQAPKP